MADFTYIPSYGSMVKQTPKIIMANFGDGYEQRLGDGINNTPSIWSLVFNGRNNSDTSAIKSFFTAQGAWDSFTWVPLGEVTERKFRCTSWTINYRGPNGSDITAEFVEVFDL